MKTFYANMSLRELEEVRISKIEEIKKEHDRRAQEITELTLAKRIVSKRRLKCSPIYNRFNKATSLQEVSLIREDLFSEVLQDYISYKKKARREKEVSLSTKANVRSLSSVDYETPQVPQLGIKMGDVAVNEVAISKEGFIKI